MASHPLGGDYLQVKLLALTSLTLPAPQVAVACSLMRLMEAESVVVCTGGANTQALSRAAAVRAVNKAVNSAYIPLTHMLGHNCVGIDDLFLNSHAHFIFQTEYK